MNANAVNVAVVDGKTITQTVELSTVKNGQPIRIKAVQGGKYILGEGEKGIAPENITIKRVGKDLHVALEGSDPDQPQLIIEDFEGSGGQLVGIAEDGSYYPYISSDAEQDRSAAFLIEGVDAPQVLGSQELTGFGNGLVAGGGIGWFWPALLGLGALGLLGGIYAATRDDGSKKDAVVPVNTDKGSVGNVHDDVGDKQGAILPGESTDDRTPTFTGIGRPGTSVEIVDNGKVIGTAPVGDDGKWEFTPAEPGLDDGSHNIVIIPVDKDGNKGDPSPGHEIIVDTVAPARPLIDGIYDDVAPQEGLIASGGHTNDTTPTINGTSEADAIIRIYDNGVEIGSIQADGDGKWSFTPDPALAEGPHEFTITAEDAAGNISAPSLPFPIIIDITAPDKPGSGTGAVDEAIDDFGPITGPIDSGDTTDDKTPTFTGGGLEPGDTVVIIDNGTEIGTAIVDEDGKWEFTPEEPGLGEGSHEIVVVIRDPAGNESEPSDPPYVVIIDTTNPGKPGAGTGGIDDALDNVGPIQGSIGDGEDTDDTTPTLVGTGGTPGNTVIIIDNGIEIGTAPVRDDGTWEFTPNPPLTEGSHEIVVVIRDPNGNESEPSDPHTIIVDTTAPGKPGTGTGGIDDVLDDVGPITGPIGNGGDTDDTTPTLEGSGAEPGDTVIIIDNGVEIGTAPVRGDGTWEFTPSPPLAQGPHELVVVIRDPAGNESVPSDPHLIIVDTVAPGVPTLDTVYDDQGAIQDFLDSGDTTDDASPELAGTAESGSLVTIYDNGIAIGSVIAAGGNWTFTPALPLSNGPHTLTVTATDAAGNESAPTPGFDLDVLAGGAPTAPAIISVFDDQGASQGPLAQNEFTDDAQPTISGTGADGDVISVFSNGNLLGTVPVVGGQWSFTPATPLPQGLNNLTALATNAAGNPSPATGDYPINVDTLAPGAPGALTLADDVGAITGPINANDTTDDANPTFGGTAEAGSVVMIYDNNLLIGSTSADPTTGAWSFTPATPLGDGPHSLSAQTVDSAGNRSPMSAAIPFIVDTSAVVISITSVVDNTGTVTGDLSNGQSTDDTTPTLNGQATPGAVVSVYDGLTLLGTVTAHATTGQWTFTTPVLGEGSHQLTATATTPAIGESAPTPVFEVVIDLTAPGVPAIDEVTDDVGAIQGPVPNGDSTDDTTPTLSGSGQTFGEIVMIYDNGLLIGSAPVMGDGSWSYTPTTPLNDGQHPITVVAVDPAGNASAPSAPWTVVIDTTAPVATAVIDSMGKDSGANSGDFLTNDGSAGRLIQGSLTAALVAGEKVQISTDGGATWLDALVNADDTWNFLDKSSHNGDWTIQARVVDAAGNANTVGQAVTMDTAAPNDPLSVTRSGDTITVTFNSAGLEVGDIVNVAINDLRVDWVLTEQDIIDGNISFDTTAGTSANIAASISDQAGNASGYVNSSSGRDFFEDFSTTLLQNILAPLDVGFFTISPTNGTSSIATDPGVMDPAGNRPAGPGLFINLIPNQNASVTLDLKGNQANSVSFNVYGTDSAGNEVVFLDELGSEVHRQPLSAGGPGGVNSGGGLFEIDMPPNVTFSSMVIVAAFNDGWVIDNLVFKNIVTDPFDQREQSIESGSDSYYGGDVDNVFILTDVSDLASINTGIQAGSGTDTLKLTGSGQNLDLTTLIDKVSSIEIIDITGTGDNTLNLSLGDVLEQGESSLFTNDDTVQMMVKGNAGDVVNLDDLLPDGTDPGDWATAGTATVAGVVYNVYQHSTLDAQLLVQDGVATNLV